MHRDHLYFAFMSWQRAVRDGKHKLIEYRVNAEGHTQFFDLDKDPDEINNLAAAPANRQTLDTLRALLKQERLRRQRRQLPFPHL